MQMQMNDFAYDDEYSITVCSHDSIFTNWKS